VQRYLYPATVVTAFDFVHATPLLIFFVAATAPGAVKEVAITTAERAVIATLRNMKNLH
jgi:hypothetical protein